MKVLSDSSAMYNQILSITKCAGEGENGVRKTLVTQIDEIEERRKKSK